MDEQATNVTEYSVSEISGAVKRKIEDDFSFVRVRGELGRVARPASGHLYFDLKDDKSVLAAVCWKGVSKNLAVTPEQGLEVICTGRLTTFPVNRDIKCWLSKWSQPVRVRSWRFSKRDVKSSRRRACLMQTEKSKYLICRK
jgi:exonuclease VII large subunit